MKVRKALASGKSEEMIEIEVAGGGIDADGNYYSHKPERRMVRADYFERLLEEIAAYAATPTEIYIRPEALAAIRRAASRMGLTEKAPQSRRHRRRRS